MAYKRAKPKSCHTFFLTLMWLLTYLCRKGKVIAFSDLWIWLACGKGLIFLMVHKLIFEDSLCFAFPYVIFENFKGNEGSIVLQIFNEMICFCVCPQDMTRKFSVQMPAKSSANGQPWWRKWAAQLQKGEYMLICLCCILLHTPSVWIVISLMTWCIQSNKI